VQQRSSMAVSALCGGAAWALATFVSLAPSPVAAQQPVVLVTAEEAAIPPLAELGEQGRGISRGPGIEPIAPGNDATASSVPLPIRIRFTPRNDVPINPDKVRVIYLRSRSVDVTSRLRGYITPGGIEIPLAVVPAGAHAFRIEVADGLGRQSVTLLRFTAKR
jgi:hypothetical protein